MHLVEGFKRDVCLPAEVAYSEQPGTNRICFDLTNPQTRQYADALAGFHAEHATMQLLCPACHKKKSTRQTGAQAAIARSAKKAVK